MFHWGERTPVRLGCEKKWAAAMSQSLQKFLPPKEKVALSTVSDAALACGTLVSHKSASSTEDFSPKMSYKPSSDAQILPGSTAEVYNESSGNDNIVFHEPGQGSCLAANIGDIFVRAKSSEEFCSAVHGLTIIQKCVLGKNHKKAGSNYISNTVPLWLQSFFRAGMAERASLDGVQ